MGDKQKNIKEKYERLFQNIPGQNTNETCRIAVKHSHKNRYSNTIPYDSNLVRLEHFCSSDDAYMNASRLHMPIPPSLNLDSAEASPRNAHLQQQLILTQCPLPNRTDADFWLMIYEQRVPIIVQVGASLPGRIDCYFNKYATDDQAKQIFGKRLKLELTQTEPTFFLPDPDCHDLEFRQFQLAVQGVPSRVHTVLHITVNNWPDFGCPPVNEMKTTISVLKLLLHDDQVGPANSVCNMNSALPVRAVIHCSAGVGRSGTLALAYYLSLLNEMKPFTELIDNESTFNMEDVVWNVAIEILRKMRKHGRMLLVQTFHQFHYGINLFIQTRLPGDNADDPNKDELWNRIVHQLTEWENKARIDQSNNVWADVLSESEQMALDEYKLPDSYLNTFASNVELKNRKIRPAAKYVNINNNNVDHDDDEETASSHSSDVSEPDEVLYSVHDQIDMVADYDDEDDGEYDAESSESEGQTRSRSPFNLHNSPEKTVRSRITTDHKAALKADEPEVIEESNSNNADNEDGESAEISKERERLDRLRVTREHRMRETKRQLELMKQRMRYQQRWLPWLCGVVSERIFQTTGWRIQRGTSLLMLGAAAGSVLIGVGTSWFMKYSGRMTASHSSGSPGNPVLSGTP